MLIFYTVLIMLIVAYSQCQEGLYAGATLVINILLAGVIAFQFWEPLADELDVLFAGGPLSGFEDAFMLVLLFSFSLIILRVLTSKLAPLQIDFPPNLQVFGGGLFGLVAGYLVAGFLICVLQTLPWHENFFYFRPRAEGESSWRRYVPPDRVWLALMRQAGAQPLAWRPDAEKAGSSYAPDHTFDSGGTFELRYLRYRRYGDQRDPLKYQSELDRELKKEKPR
jgi:hypothetical protein